MKKLVNKKGFTLMEMLIVVAIIAILVAISIPTFSGSLDKANSATDAANLRAAKAVVVNGKLDADSAVTDGYFYNVDKGAFEEDEDANSKGKCKNHAEAYIMYDAASDSVVWAKADGTILEDAKQDCSN